MVVAIAVGRQGINTLLIASQVALSIVLPFVALPLIWFTTSKSVMSVRKPSVPSSQVLRSPVEDAIDGHHRECDTSQQSSLTPRTGEDEKTEDVISPIVEEKRDQVVIQIEEDNRSLAEPEEWISFANGRLVTVVSCIVFFIIFAADVYVIVMLGLGQSD